VVVPAVLLLFRVRAWLQRNRPRWLQKASGRRLDGADRPDPPIARVIVALYLGKFLNCRRSSAIFDVIIIGAWFRRSGQRPRCASS
jgi:hypothetical protein